MREIIFSVFDHGPDALARLRGLLGRFEQMEDIHVHLEAIPWALGWSRLVEIALYHSGPDVSEVGSSWVGDLVRMQALHSFRQDEIDRITEMARFFPNVWVRGSQGDQDTAIHFSIPWSGDVRVVFYLRDILEKAGIDETTAFRDAASFDRTLAALQKKGVPVPLVMPTHRSNVTIHNLASWIWGAGGEFLTDNGKRIVFDSPQALEGFKAYFRLGRFLAPEVRSMDESVADNFFMSGRAAVIQSGYWILQGDLGGAEAGHRLGVVPMLGGSYVGGHHLVVWNHSRQIPNAVKLIHFLESDEVVQVIFPQFGLPISESQWAHSPFDSQNYQVLLRAFKQGRCFPSGELWGLVEKRLVDVLAEIWRIYLENPESSLDKVVEERVKGLARRVQLSLET